ncbi:MAG: hypothetical protein IPL10_03990 [Bacteroidetes bacterium]|nr:hypothetical protein [Bacteroidota bacterium]
MKNLLTIAIFCIIISASNLFAQSNLTWTIKDELGKGAVKTTTVFNSNFSGFLNKQEAIAFCQKLKTNPEVASCEIIANNGTNSDMKLVMKQAHNKQYYIAFAQKQSITSISVNGQKKTTEQMLQDIRNKKK